MSVRRASHPAPVLALAALAVTPAAAAGPPALEPILPAKAASVLAQDASRDLLIEGIAFHKGRWFVSAIAGRTILEVKAGKLVPFLRPDAATGAVFGLAVDAPRGVLWAAEAWGEGLPGGSGRKRTGLLKVALADGRVLARYPAIEAVAFGDVVVDPAGAVYASDGSTGAVWVLAPGDAGLRQVSHPPGATSAQGMVLCPLDVMVMSDYATGLHRVDLGDGSSSPIPAPIKIAGLDGMVVTGRRDKVEVLATYNGSAPHRLMRLTLSADCRRVEKVETLIRGAPLVDTTLLAPSPRGLGVVSDSQWAGRTPAGTRNDADPGPATVALVKLPPPKS